MHPRGWSSLLLLLRILGLKCSDTATRVSVSWPEEQSSPNRQSGWGKFRAHVSAADAGYAHGSSELRRGSQELRCEAHLMVQMNLLACRNKVKRCWVQSFSFTLQRGKPR